MIYDLIIIGSGAAGLSGALYAGRYQMRVLLIGQKLGGSAAQAGVIWNYPGLKSVDGFDLAYVMKNQAQALGVEFLEAKVEKIIKNKDCFEVMIQSNKYQAKAVIIAIGIERKKLNLPNEATLINKGVHYCVTCDGPLYKDKVVAMVGGSDAAIKGVNLLAEYAKKIYIINLENQITAEPINFEQTKKLGDKVKIILGNTVKALLGYDKLEKIILAKPYQNQTELSVDGVFVEIGAKPNIDFVGDLGLQLDAQGFIQVNNLMQTNVTGVFAAGDIVNHFGHFKQIVTAVAMGSVAATSVYNYLKNNGHSCVMHAKPKK